MGIKSLVIFQTKIVSKLYSIHQILSVVTWYVRSLPTDEKQVIRVRRQYISTIYVNLLYVTEQRGVGTLMDTQHSDGIKN